MAGFFSALIGGVRGAIGGFLGQPAAPAAAAPIRAALPVPVTPVARGPIPGPVFDIKDRLEAFRRARLRALPHPGPVGAPDPVAGMHVHMGGGAGRGNGMVARQTIVQTIDLQTGALLRQLVFDGAPFLMNSDVRKLRSISRKVSKAHSKLPRRVVKESKMKQLTDAAVDEAMRKVGSVSCPPKC